MKYRVTHTKGTPVWGISNGNRLVGLVCDGAGLDTGYCYLPSYVAVQQ